MNRSLQSQCAALVLALAAPAFAYAATMHSGETVVYQTTLRPYNSNLAYPTTGALQITTSKDGVIWGYYRPSDTNDFIPVTGGIDGDNVWINIGRAHVMRIQGSYHDGEIVGTAFGPNNELLTFDATDARIKR